ncbi:MAG: hypothetical protein A2504_04290 [Bdellovibrionales bacterium RIFOXYD12_FULL_39_22]|nr:MAG: hypothetical protein A2385_07535 [Bdellovibrionales bacterium RIFOXYB1_FULL_39_21]OFZ42111.1 MAG: hypothetical protein A2485_09505 [Bdellovibrionales bacterium RIFOXYC12_FULL_39_17]OFZ50827.1 MAG: hypothetical protein A2404_06455 [Bdellovibrionales bacterium RIFOXYC1_FULL_39_130]OFZ78050.1 MAG: hypothetical protein A2560_01625 [Bdellovibrionales bacterium RIFOXYD1_FULL_39_84]OFZ93514.1 MAG: hypothetical protein A2504_04290 [Bdellovibrionales bacterium RIFOXYD12_FULL_39_22]HLE10365.1 hy
MIAVVINFISWMIFFITSFFSYNVFAIEAVNYRQRAQEEINSPTIEKSGPGMVEKNSAVVSVSLPKSPVEKKSSLLSFQLLANQSRLKGKIPLRGVGDVDAGQLDAIDSLMLSSAWHLFHGNRVGGASAGPQLDFAYGSTTNTIKTSSDFSLEETTLTYMKLSAGLFIEKSFGVEKKFKTAINATFNYRQYVQTNDSELGRFSKEGVNLAVGINQKYLFYKKIFAAGELRYYFTADGDFRDLYLPSAQLFVGLGTEI